MRGRPGHRGGTRSLAQGLGPEVACRSGQNEGQEGERQLKHPSRCAETPAALLSLSAGAAPEEGAAERDPREPSDPAQVPPEAPGSHQISLKGVKTSGAALAGVCTVPRDALGTRPPRVAMHGERLLPHGCLHCYLCLC